MKAMAADGKGLEKVRCQDVPVPEVGPGDVRIRILTAALNPADFKVWGGGALAMFLHGQSSPVVTGYDLCGIVDAVGASVTGFKVGDRVAGFLAYGRSTKRGSFAEFAVAPASTLSQVPAGVSDAVAAALPTGGCTALQGLRNVASVSAGARVLVVGAAGGVGTAVIGVGKRLGVHVTAVVSTPSIEFVRSLGADEVVDRKTTDPLSSQEKFDLIYDAAAAWTFGSCAHLLADGGVYLTTLPSLSFAMGALQALFSSKSCRFIAVSPSASDLAQLFDWVQGGLPIPVDSVVPIRDLPTALARLKQGGVAGKVVVDVAGGW